MGKIIFLISPPIISTVVVQLSLTQIVRSIVVYDIWDKIYNPACKKKSIEIIIINIFNFFAVLFLYYNLLLKLRLITIINI